MFNLENKTALVTGASGGIGKAIAKALYSQGATVILSGRNEEKLNQVKNELGERSHIVVADIASAEDCQKLITESEKITGQVDILICNAGVTKDNLTLRMKDEEWSEVLDVNLKASFILNKGFLRKMFKNRWGRIINITSIVGVTGNPGQANYAASKAGMIGMTKSIASEAASRGVTINCIAPGFIATAMTDALNEEQKSVITNKIPSGELGSPEDIANAAVYLASNEARYVTGQTIHVNGGMLMV